MKNNKLKDEFLIKEICRVLEISYLDFLRNQKQRYVLGRYLFAFLAKKHDSKRTLKSIGNVLNLHHATVLHAFRAIETYIQLNTKIDGVNVKQLVKTINSSSEIETKPIENVFGYAALNKRKALLV